MLIYCMFCTKKQSPYFNNLSESEKMCFILSNCEIAETSARLLAHCILRVERRSLIYRYFMYNISIGLQLYLVLFRVNCQNLLRTS